eukprot:Ihof_evm11s133 gene=Ihof_evmTU11s133
MNTLHKSIADDWNAIYTIKCVVENAHEDSVWGVVWVSKDKILTGSVDETIKVWDCDEESPTCTNTLQGHELGVVSVDVSQDGAMAVSSSLDSNIKLWDLNTNQLIRSIDAVPARTWQAKLSPDSKYLATGTFNGTVDIYEVATGTKKTEPYSPDGKSLAYGSIDGSVRVTNLETGQAGHALEGHAMPVRSVSFSPNGQLLASACDDGQVKLYDMQGGKVVNIFSGHTSWVLCVAFHPYLSQFATGSSDKKVKIWDYSTKECVHTFECHTDQ